jgi:ornithine--oxo-acid transaminase
LAEKLLRYTPFLDKVFFANSGGVAVEASMKFARRATGRPGLVYCAHAFHGLSYGALSLNGDRNFRDGFSALLPYCYEVPFNDLEALERALATRQVAAFILEPIQGKGVNIPDDGFLSGVQGLRRKFGTLLIADEIQTGLGRTGRFLAIEHWGIEPDMVLLSKTLSGGHVPVAALLTRKWILNSVFDRMDRAVVHSLTFANNDLAMAAGIATLEVLESERLIENAARRGASLLAAFQAMATRYEMIRDVRGKGLMIGIEFGRARSLKLQAAWALLETVSATAGNTQDPHATSLSLGRYATGFDQLSSLEPVRALQGPPRDQIARRADNESKRDVKRHAATDAPVRWTGRHALNRFQPEPRSEVAVRA